MKNPLTYKERAQLGRIFEHDVLGEFTILQNSIFSIHRDIDIIENGNSDMKKKAIKRLSARAKNEDFIDSINSFIVDSMHFTKHVIGDGENELWTTTHNQERLETFIRKNTIINNEIVNLERLEIDIENEINFPKHAVSLILYNLMKNSYKANGGEEVGIEITANLFEGEVPKCMFPSPVTQGEFLKLHYRDHGPGFKKNKVYKKYFDLGVSGNSGYGSGFGLYLVRMASKYMYAHLDAISSDDGAEFTFYIPQMDVENEEN